MAEEAGSPRLPGRLKREAAASPASARGVDGRAGRSVDRPSVWACLRFSPDESHITHCRQDFPKRRGSGAPCRKPRDACVPRSRAADSSPLLRARPPQSRRLTLGS